MNSKFLAATVIALVAIGPTAMAQQPYPLRVPPGGAIGDSSIQVSVSYNLTVALTGDDETHQANALEKGRRLIYGIAAGECKVLESTIATSCRMERLNVQSNVSRSSRSSEHVIVGANATYRVSLK